MRAVLVLAAVINSAGWASFATGMWQQSMALFLLGIGVTLVAVLGYR